MCARQCKRIRPRDAAQDVVSALHDRGASAWATQHSKGQEGLALSRRHHTALLSCNQQSRNNQTACHKCRVSTHLAVEECWDVELSLEQHGDAAQQCRRHRVTMYRQRSERSMLRTMPAPTAQ